MLFIPAVLYSNSGLNSVISSPTVKRKSQDESKNEAPDNSQKQPTELSYVAKYAHLARNARDWHDYAQMEADKLRKGPGEQGQSVQVPAAAKDAQLALYRVNGYDAYASDMIKLDRSVKDIRHPHCKQRKYLEKLPNVAVILPFHNEVEGEVCFRKNNAAQFDGAALGAFDNQPIAEGVAESDHPGG